MNRKKLKIFFIHFTIIYIIISFLPFNQIAIVAKPFYYIMANLAYAFITKTILSAILSIILTYIYIKLDNKNKK